MPMIGVVIPAYNAAKTLPSVVARLPAELQAELLGIWIVNDGSSDDTSQVARRLGGRQPCLTVIDLPENRGYGAAVKVGLERARRANADYVVCIHADGQYAPEEVPRLLQTLRLQRLDLLQGSRIASGTARSGGMPLYKFVANRTLTKLENAVFGLHMTDYHSGLLVYGPRTLHEVRFESLSDSFDFDLEVIASAHARGLQVGEAPIPTHYGEEVSYLNPITYGFRVLGVMGKYLRGRYRPRTDSRERTQSI